MEDGLRATMRETEGSQITVRFVNEVLQIHEKKKRSRALITHPAMVYRVCRKAAAAAISVVGGAEWHLLNAPAAKEQG